MISSGGGRFVLAIELKSNGFDCESAHLVVEAKRVGSWGRRNNLVITLLLTFKE